ncbi:cupin [Candidatus Daviesbacteria bacterium]|nr:cupin [Candidatus Daviesbacteria bacterium]
MASKDLDDFLKTIDKSKFTNQPFSKRVPKPWGYELIFTPEKLPYTGKIMHIEAGKRQSLQIHDQKQETYFLASGQGGVIIEDSQGELKEVEFEQGKGYTTMVGQRHRLFAITDCDIWEVSTPEVGTTIRLEDDYNRGNETEEVRKDPNRGWNLNN